MFDEVIGQESVVKVLKAIVRRNSYKSAYMFSGPSGVGKTTLGRIFSMAILCEDPRGDGNPCGGCESCKSFLQEANFGYKELDAASFGGKEDMVKLRDEASFQSVSKKKIILLDECHDISKSGQDALLKQTEQCPEHLIYIFCTTEPEKMNKTIRGRCMEFQASRVSSDLVVKRLGIICENEGIEYQEGGLRAIVAETNGQVRDAIKLVEQTSLIGGVTVENLRAVSRNYDEEIFEILSNLGTDLPKALEYTRRVSSFIPVSELYANVLSMLSDTAKLIYGYDEFESLRKTYLEKLKDIHGFSLLEFLSYLITRDKYVDKIGLQSDIVLLHYKFGTQSFKPQPVAPPQQQQQPVVQNLPEQKQSEPQKEAEKAPERSAMSHSQLQKLSLKERTKYLREQRRLKKDGEQKEPERVPQEWPLPKEQRIGESSLEEEELSPEDFSKLLVGGRSGS